MTKINKFIHLCFQLNHVFSPHVTGISEHLSTSNSFHRTNALLYWENNSVAPAILTDEKYWLDVLLSGNDPCQ